VRQDNSITNAFFLVINAIFTLVIAVLFHVIASVANQSAPIPSPFPIRGKGVNPPHYGGGFGWGLRLPRRFAPRIYNSFYYPFLFLLLPEIINTVMRISQILKDSEYKLDQFENFPQYLIDLENRIEERTKGEKTEYYAECLARKKSIKLTPEEVIRQLFLMRLNQDYGYSYDRIQVEVGINFGLEVKRADIVIFEKDHPTTQYLIVELKKPKLKDGKEQLRSYLNATGATMGIWSNGQQISFYHRKDPNFFEDLRRIPFAHETLAEVLQAKFTIEDLIKSDKLVNQRKSLKDLILEMEDEVLANAGVDVFEELFKLIFTKLFDELKGGRDKSRNLDFRNSGQTDNEMKEKLQNLFDKAKKEWEGVFEENAKLLLSPSHLAVCVSSLQDVKLFNSNLDVVDDAFEYLVNKSSKGEKGQYFTPRYVIDMCVKMMNPKPNEFLMDTAAGSSGFPLHAIFHVWKNILKEKGKSESELFTIETKPAECYEYVKEKVFAIDFDEKSVRVARTLNLIAGDGQTNVLHLNTLDYDRWDEIQKEELWNDTYTEGWKRLKKLRGEKDKNREFNFDILLANPPFAGEIKENKMLARYELGKKDNGKYENSVSRHILFIERNLQFLKPGGRMAVVLPQGVFNNASEKRIRNFIAERCRILAVVGLHGNTFKPHTGTKTSVLFVQKWNDDPKLGSLCPKVEDYPIFFATQTKPAKDNSGDKIYVKDANGQHLLDSHGHLIVDHDLYNHDNKTQPGIAEAFAEFAKKEQLSFF